MNTFIEERYLSEIIKQANNALYSYDLISSLLKEEGGANDDIFRELEHLVLHVAAISQILWSTKKKKRSADLRKKIEVEDNNLLNGKSLRNHLVHFDERLDKWTEESKSHNFIDQNIGDIKNITSGIEETDYIRNFDPVNYIFSFYHQNFSIKEMIEEIKNLKQKAISFECSL